jgi:hypothetical protein
MAEEQEEMKDNDVVIVKKEKHKEKKKRHKKHAAKSDEARKADEDARQGVLPSWFLNSSFTRLVDDDDPRSKLKKTTMGSQESKANEEENLNEVGIEQTSSPSNVSTDDPTGRGVAAEIQALQASNPKRYERPSSSARPTAASSSIHMGFAGFAMEQRKRELEAREKAREAKELLAQGRGGYSTFDGKSAELKKFKQEQQRKEREAKESLHVARTTGGITPYNNAAELKALKIDQQQKKKEAKESLHGFKGDVGSPIIVSKKSTASEGNQEQ